MYIYVDNMLITTYNAFAKSNTKCSRSKGVL